MFCFCVMFCNYCNVVFFVVLSISFAMFCDVLSFFVSFDLASLANGYLVFQSHLGFLACCMGFSGMCWNVSE